MFSQGQDDRPRAGDHGQGNKVVAPEPETPIQISGLKMPRGIAIDWVAGNVYWTDSGRDVIEVAQMKGENRKTLISGMIDEPHAIVVDPLRGWARVLGGRHLGWW